MTGRIGAFARDRRARIPFAVIALLLLVSSGTFVVHLHEGGDTAPAFETDRAMDQTEGAARTALSQALADASERAAAQPLTEPSDTPYGRVLDANESDEPFDRYLETLVYLETAENLDTVGQRVGDTETSVAVPEIAGPHGFASALDRVTVRNGEEHADIEPGVIEAEIENVTIVATRNGREIDRRTVTLTVATATPLYQLHDRTSTFQERLEAGITEPGFSQRFNAYIYALGWARGYAQYAGAPVTEVIANRHVVPAANDAVYRTQKDVFGSPDPDLSNTVRRGWLCMAMHDAEGLYGGLSGRETSYAGDLCDASGLLFGDQATGELPESPGVMDVLGKAPGMGAEHTIGVNRTAYLPLREMVAGSGKHSLDSVIDRVFEVEAETSHSVRTVSEPSFSHDPPRPYEFGRSSVVGTTNERTTVDVHRLAESEDDERYYEIEGTVRLRLNQTKEHTYRDGDRLHETTTSARGTRVIEFELSIEEGETSPNASIDQYNREGASQVRITQEHTYGPGPSNSRASESPTIPTGPTPAGYRNYGDVGEKALIAYFGSGDENRETSQRPTAADVEAVFEESWSDARQAQDLAFPGRRVVSVDPPARTDLERLLVRDLTGIQENASEITHTFERRDVLHDGSGTGPYGELIAKVGRAKRAYLDRERPYANVGQKAVYEARYVYFEALESDLERLEATHGAAMDELDAKLSDVGIERALSYLQQGVTATPPDPVPLESSSLTDTVTYDVSGSPTYLVAENVTTEEVPAVGNDVEAFAPLAVRNRNYFGTSYREVADGLLSRLAGVIGIGSPDAEMTFGMASDALRSSQLATEAARDGDYGDELAFEQLTGVLRANLDEAISEFESELADQIAFRLYPDSVVDACAPSGCSRNQRAELESAHPESVRCNRGGCEFDVDVPDDCHGDLCAFEEGSAGQRARPAIQRAVEAAVGEYSDSTEATAEAIDSGKLNGRIVDAVFHELNDTRERPAYAREMDAQQWRAVIESATRPAAMTAANEGSITVSDADLVEDLDSEIRRALGNVSEDVLRDRVSDRTDGTDPDLETYDDWIQGVDSSVRVPAGMPLLPYPNLWFATVNVWDVELEGEYARFEVSANVGSPETAGTTSYVREESSVDVEIGGEPRRLGSVEPISFSGRSLLVVVVPPGGIGVGDRDGDDPECSPTWPVAGDVSDGEIQCGGEPWR